jgi:hypothetical protein
LSQFGYYWLQFPFGNVGQVYDNIRNYVSKLTPWKDRKQKIGFFYSNADVGNLARERTEIIALLVRIKLVEGDFLIF